MTTVDYTDDLNRLRALLIVTSLQKRKDLRAFRLVRDFPHRLDWSARDELVIDPDVWKYVVDVRGYDPKIVFCHPDLLVEHPSASLYYRGLSALSLKQVSRYCGQVKNLESGTGRPRLSRDRATKIARVYNTFVCCIIENSAAWTLANGKRTIIATLGITLDGVMRNKIGDVAEERIRALVMEFAMDKNVLVEPAPASDELLTELPRECLLTDDVTMTFGSEPDIAFTREGELLAVIEIKGGIDEAGVYERYGAAKKSFEHAMRTSPHCTNIYLPMVCTPGLLERIDADRLVDRYFDINSIIEKPEERDRFLQELFHHVLRLV